MMTTFARPEFPTAGTRIPGNASAVHRGVQSHSRTNGRRSVAAWEAGRSSCLVVGRASLAVIAKQGGDRDVAFVRTLAPGDLDITAARLRIAGIVQHSVRAPDFMTLLERIARPGGWDTILIDTSDPLFHPNHWAAFIDPDAVRSLLGNSGVIAYGPLRAVNDRPLPDQWAHDGTWTWPKPLRPVPVRGGWFEIANHL